MRFSFVLQYRAVWVILGWLFWVSVSPHGLDQSLLDHTEFFFYSLSCDHFLMKPVTPVLNLYILFYSYISNFSKIYFVTLTAGLGKIWSWRIGFPSRIWLVFESQWPHPLGSWIRIWIWITGRVIKWIKRNSCIKYKEAQKQTSRL